MRSRYIPARTLSTDVEYIRRRAGEYTSGLSLLEGRKAAEKAAFNSRELIGGSSDEAEDSEGVGASIPAVEAGATGVVPEVNGLIKSRALAPLVVPASQGRNDITPCRKDNEE